MVHMMIWYVCDNHTWIHLITGIFWREQIVRLTSFGQKFRERLFNITFLGGRFLSNCFIFGHRLFMSLWNTNRRKKITKIWVLFGNKHRVAYRCSNIRVWIGQHWEMMWNVWWMWQFGASLQQIQLLLLAHLLWIRYRWSSFAFSKLWNAGQTDAQIDQRYHDVADHALRSPRQLGIAASGHRYFVQHCLGRQWRKKSVHCAWNA